MKVTQPLKWHGGKAYLAPRIVALMPPHVTYCEPFAGGLAVLLAKDPEGVSECVNDLHGNLSHFWQTLRDEEQFPKFLRRVQATPFSERDFVAALAMLDFPPADPVLRAWAFFVRCRMSLAGRMRSFTGVTKTRTRRGMSNEVSAWLTAIEGLPEVHARLKRVLILNRDALDVIRGQDSSGTMYYVDPPYLQSTRTAPDVYRHEMSVEQHAALLDTLSGIRGKFVLSGYRCDPYDAHAERHGWHRTDFDVPNHSSHSRVKKRMVESTWKNF